MDAERHTPTSSINSERILFLQNTLTISQNHGPWTPMVYYGTLDASMFWILEISNSMFSSTHMTTPLQDISVRWRHSIKSAGITIGLDFLLSRMGFPFWLKSKEVKIGNEKMSWIIIKEKLSERAVMKENGLRWVYLQERRITPKGT